MVVASVDVYVVIRKSDFDASTCYKLKDGKIRISPNENQKLNIPYI